MKNMVIKLQSTGRTTQVAINVIGGCRLSIIGWDLMPELGYTISGSKSMQMRKERISMIGRNISVSNSKIFFTGKGPSVTIKSSRVLQKPNSDSAKGQKGAHYLARERR